MNKYAYPIYISNTPNGKEDCYQVYIPDLDGYTQGKDIVECIEMARDFIGNRLMEIDSIPEPNSMEYHPNEKEIKSLVDVDLSKYKLSRNNRPVKKTLTIPSYLNELGQKAGINFSQTLAEAIKIKLGI